MNMKASDFTNSRFFAAADFGDQPPNWTIASVSSELIGRDDPAKKVVVQLIDSNDKPAGRELVLNKSNIRALAKPFGDIMETWVGRPIRIQSIWVNFRGEQVRGIRVMPGVVAMRAVGGAAQSQIAGAADDGATRSIKDDLDDEIPL
jgi:hypothetical protein